MMRNLKDWFEKHRITEVECIIPDLTGIARGKIMPADKFLLNEGLRMPEAVFLQRVTGEWLPYEELYGVDPAEIDMQLKPDPSTTQSCPGLMNPPHRLSMTAFTTTAHLWNYLHETFSKKFWRFTVSRNCNLQLHRN